MAETAFTLKSLRIITIFVLVANIEHFFLMIWLMLNLLVYSLEKCSHVSSFKVVYVFCIPRLSWIDISCHMISFNEKHFRSVHVYIFFFNQQGAVSNCEDLKYWALTQHKVCDLKSTMTIYDNFRKKLKQIFSLVLLHFFPSEKFLGCRDA